MLVPELSYATRTQVANTVNDKPQERLWTPGYDPRRRRLISIVVARKFLPILSAQSESRWPI